MYSNNLPEFSSLWQRFHYLGSYQQPLDTLLMRGKYQQNLVILKTLASLFVNSLRNTPFAEDATLIPVPMSQQRYLKRGYNQAEIIAREIASQLAMDFSGKLLRHTGQAGVQHELGRKARLRNMRNAFEVIGEIPERLCVVDDIYTTGATIQAMCQFLRSAGCEYIEIWIIAKTL